MLDKKIIFVIVCFFGMIPSIAQISVVTSTPNQAALVKEIGKNLVTVKSICKPRENHHFIDINPIFMHQLHNAQLFLETGLGSEAWVIPTLEGARNSKIQPGNLGHMDCSRGIAILDIPKSISRDQGDIHAQGNPHYLLDPVNSKYVVYNIYKKLSVLDPKNADIYKKNFKNYMIRLKKSLVQTLTKSKPYRGKIKIVSYHGNWSYLLRRFGFKYVGTIEAKPGIAPSSSHLQALIAKMKRENCKIILVANWYSRKTADYVAKNTTAKVLHLPIQVGGQQGVDNYLQLVDKIVNEIIAAHNN